MRVAYHYAAHCYATSAPGELSTGAASRDCHGATNRDTPIASSSNLFGHDQMRLTLTTIIGIDSGLEFVGTQQSVRFRHRPLAMDPFRLDRVKPGAFAGQWADHETDSQRA